MCIVYANFNGAKIHTRLISHFFIPFPASEMFIADCNNEVLFASHTVVMAILLYMLFYITSEPLTP